MVMPHTLFISDLHLAPDLPRTTAGFLHFLEHEAQGADALYVLGDLFEVWVGDDNHNDYNDAAIAAFRRLSDAGTALYFVHGNRDFFLGQDFAAACGGTLLSDAETVDLYGHPTLIMHGDQLCTLDEKYMAFRAQSRSPAWQSMMLGQPLEARLNIATMWRMQSKMQNSNKPENIMDVTPDEVLRVMQEAQTLTLIHGHTHRPQVHKVSLGEQQGQRIVLGDWREDSGEAFYARASSNGVELLPYHF